MDTPWAVDAIERRKMCCLNYTILGITLNDYMPCIIRAHGISALPVRQLISQLRLNRSLKGEYFRAAINIKSQEKKGRAGTAYALHPKIVGFITDETKTIELKAGSDRLLSTSIPLPEGRPEEEPLPLGFTPEGIPIYSEAERDRLMAQTPALAEAPPTTTAPSDAPPQKPAEKVTDGLTQEQMDYEAAKADQLEPEPSPEEIEEEKGKPTEKTPLDLDF